MQRIWLFVPAMLSVALLAQAPPAPRRNIVIFVADGLRHGSVNERDMPTLSALRAEGVDFQNSYSVYPTLTMANASAIATGHRLGDTGVFSNSIWPLFRAFDSGTFGNNPSTPVPSLENDQVLGDMDEHYGGNFLTEKTLLAMAREHGYNTAALGKLGPATLQDVTVISPEGAAFPDSPATVIFDDATGGPTGIPLPLPVVLKLRQAGLASQPPPRAVPNVAQQQWLADAATRVVLPMFETELTQAARPFALVFWSRDPDGAQHGENDSPGRVSPGINGPTPLLGLQNADRNLKQILDWLKARPAIEANTDVFVTSDHGFATISRKEIDASGRTTASPSATRAYVGPNGRVDTETGTLPAGFLAIDLATGLHLNLFDPDRRAVDGEAPPFHKVRLESGQGPGQEPWEHPAMGSGLLDTVVNYPDGSDARVIVAANGGSDLIYVPDGNADTVRTIVQQLLTYDYVSGIFVDDRFPGIPGTLPLSAIGLVGSTSLPRPAIVVGFKVFYLKADDIQTAVQVTDTPLLEGQGHHGGFGRETTFNTMAARGPDFKRGFGDPAPVSNADIAETLAHVLGFDLAPTGTLRGRVIREALAGGAAPAAADLKYLVSPAANGLRTALYYRELDGERYGETACRVPDDRQDPASAAACRR